MEWNRIAVVSGLPRSGTSLMMQMLVAGGLPALTDGIRQRDESNPRGYYELEAVKRTKRDPTWLDGAVGKCVKVVSVLLYDLPPDRRYKVVFMARPLDEVLASQAAMLKARGVRDKLDDTEMRRHFESHLAKLEKWLAGRANYEVMRCEYGAVLAEPATQAARVQTFLGADLDTTAMAAAVDLGLHRQQHS